MKILFLSLDRDLLKNDPSKGVVKRHSTYSNLLDKQAVIVYAPDKFGLSDKRWQSNLQVYSSGGCCKLAAAWRMYQLGVQLLSREKFDLISTQDPFETGLIGYWLKKKFRLKLNVQLHGDFFGSYYFIKQDPLNFVRRIIAKFLLRRADSIRAVSQRLAQSLQKMKIPAKKIVVVPVFVDVAGFARKPVRLDLHLKYPGKFLILSAGRLVREKNLTLLIKAFNQVCRDFPQAQLLIVGDGPDKKRLQKLVSFLNINQAVEFCGWQDDLASYYKTSDLFVVTSISEGYNRTIVEAMACGLPVVMTNVGLADEVVIDGVNGLVVALGDNEGLIKAMETIITDQALREKIILGGRKTIAGLFSQDKNFQEQLNAWKIALFS